jgi:hypothetical protein
MGFGWTNGVLLSLLKRYQLFPGNHTKIETVREPAPLERTPSREIPSQEPMFLGLSSRVRGDAAKDAAKDAAAAAAALTAESARDGSPSRSLLRQLRSRHVD